MRRAIYDFDFRQEVAGIDDAGEVASTEVRNYRGKVCWRDGAVRYEFTGPPPMPANEKTRRSVVIRTDRSLASAFVDVGGQPEVRAAGRARERHVVGKRLFRLHAAARPAVVLRQVVPKP